MAPIPLMDMSRLIVLARALQYDLVDEEGGGICSRLESQRARDVALELLRQHRDPASTTDSASPYAPAVAQLRRIAGVHEHRTDPDGR